MCVGVLIYVYDRGKIIRSYACFLYRFLCMCVCQCIYVWVCGECVHKVTIKKKNWTLKTKGKKTKSLKKKKVDLVDCF